MRPAGSLAAENLLILATTMIKTATSPDRATSNHLFINTSKSSQGIELIVVHAGPSPQE